MSLLSQEKEITGTELVLKQTDSEDCFLLLPFLLLSLYEFFVMALQNHGPSLDLLPSPSLRQKILFLILFAKQGQMVSRLCSLTANTLKQNTENSCLNTERSYRLPDILPLNFFFCCQYVVVTQFHSFQRSMLSMLFLEHSSSLCNVDISNLRSLHDKNACFSPMDVFQRLNNHTAYTLIRIQFKIALPELTCLHVVWGHSQHHQQKSS